MPLVVETVGRPSASSTCCRGVVRMSRASRIRILNGPCFGNSCGLHLLF